MTTQPEALSEQEAAHIYRLRDEIMRQENEMYLLRQQIERLSLDSVHTCHSECQRPVCKLTRERDALLEALKQIEPILVRMYGPQAADLPPIQIVRAAIAKVEGEKT